MNRILVGIGLAGIGFWIFAGGYEAGDKSNKIQVINGLADNLLDKKRISIETWKQIKEELEDL